MKDHKRKKRILSAEQVSAGGVAYRQHGGQIEFAVVLILPDLRWQLPKGMIDPGETFEQAAIREVREEAGIEADLLEPIATTEYWFHVSQNGERTRFHKFVHWFLMRYRSGSVEDHDHEVAESRWVTIEEAKELLVFKNERAVVAKACDLIKSL